MLLISCTRISGRVWQGRLHPTLPWALLGMARTARGNWAGSSGALHGVLSSAVNLVLWFFSLLHLLGQDSSSPCLGPGVRCLDRLGLVRPLSVQPLHVASLGFLPAWRPRVGQPPLCGPSFPQNKHPKEAQGGSGGWGGGWGKLCLLLSQPQKTQNELPSS